MIVVTAAVKGGVGKTTASVYLAALAASGRRSATLIDADPQASAAEWAEQAPDDRFAKIDVVEAPTDRLLARALGKVSEDEVALVDPAPGNERLLGKALERADVVVIPTRVGGVETVRAQAALDLVPEGTPAGLVISSARTFTRDYAEAMAHWSEQGARVWGTIPERVAIATGPSGPLSEDGLEAYRKIWRKVQVAARR